MRIDDIADLLRAAGETCQTVIRDDSGSCPQPFLDPHWLLLWGQHFLPQGQVIVTVPDAESRWLKFTPLYRDDLLVAGMRYRTLRILGAPNAGWVDVTAADTSDECCFSFVSSLRQVEMDWDIALLHRVRGLERASALADSARRAGLAARYYACGRLVGTRVYGSGAEYLASRQKSFLGGVRRHQRRMAEDGNVQMHIFGAGSSRTCIEALDWIDSIVANSWQGRSNSSVFSPQNREVREFHLKLLSSSRHGRYAPTVAVLTLDGAPVAYQYGFQSTNHYTNYAREYDERVGARSPGGVLNALYLPAMFDSGVRTVDFGVGDARDKRKWGDWTETLYSVYLFHGGWRSRLFRLFQDCRRSGKKAYYDITGKDPFKGEG